MNLNDLKVLVRSYTRDFTNSIFRDADVVLYINEGINRCRQVIPELKGMAKLTVLTQEVNLLPDEYHHLIAVYSASRCYAQDERHYQASTLMNEFETKMDELKQYILNGDVIILDGNGDAVESSNAIDYVDLSAYWESTVSDLDLGVEGVE